VPNARTLPFGVDRAVTVDLTAVTPDATIAVDPAVDPTAAAGQRVLLTANDGSGASCVAHITDRTGGLVYELILDSYAVR
jgi:hypothetical protein